MVNHRNYVASLSQLGRWLGDEAETLGVTVLPETTYILIDHIHEAHRRIFTDGRAWPQTVAPTFTLL